MEQLDEIDVEILKRLQEDGRISFNTIASELKISPPTVKYRVDKLKKRGFIKKFSVLLDPNKFKDGFFVYILIEAKFQESPEIIKKLEEVENIQEIYAGLGRNNIILKLFVENNEELNNFINNTLSQFRDINNFQAITVLQTVKRGEDADILKPGFGIRLFCNLCYKEIKDNPVKKVINNEEYFFCCETCAKVFIDKMDKLPPIKEKK